MAASPVQLNFGASGPVHFNGLTIFTGLRRTQGLVTDCSTSEALSNSLLHSEDYALPPEEQQEALWKEFFSDTAQWWDNRRSKLTSRHPDFKHKKSKAGLWLDNRRKPRWVDAQLAAWDAGKRPSGGHSELSLCGRLCEEGRISDAVNALNLLVQQECHVPSNLFYRILKSCIAQKDLVLGRRIHSLTVKSGYEGDGFLATHLIGLYASHGKLEEAMHVFSKVTTPDAYNWANIIFAYARHGEAAQAIQLYRQMCQSKIQPDNRIYSAVLKACASAGDLAAGKEVHAHILASPGTPDLFVRTGLVDMYAKCGSLEDARAVFDRLPRGDVVAWTAMIAGYAQQGMGQEALTLYDRMQQEGISAPDSFTFASLLQACASVGADALHKGKQLHAQIEERGLQHNRIVGTCLVDMYTKCGNVEDARRVFNMLRQRNVVTWTVMIAGYVQQGMGQEALDLYTSMQLEGITPPDTVTFVCLLQACAIVAALPLGKQLHAQIEERALQSDLVVGAALVNMYAKCGSMVDAEQVFHSLPERTIEAWGALACGYSRQGDSKALFNLLDRMRLQSLAPDSIAFLSVLSVCSHVGLVDKGREYFESMRTDYGISPTVEHYTCMMDLLGRAGYLEEALQMAKTMPFPSDSTVWLSLLGACRKWNNIEIGQQAFEFAVSVDEKDAASYVLMSNIYKNAQMWEEANEMQARRVRSGAYKKPGQSWWTDLRGVVHTFLVGDKKHTESEAIYARLEQLLPRMKKEGYVPHLSSSLRDIPDAEKEADLCGHSEKLAIAYALNKTSEGTTIRIVKNLRVCIDCHTATAYISKVEKRTIICRDASRFHVFNQGKCSCGDYW